MLDLIEMGDKDLRRDIVLNYTSSQSITEFVHAIAEVILEVKLKELEKSEVFSIVIDESTDKRNRKRLLVYANYLSGQDMRVFLMNNIEITDSSACADIIVSHVLSELEQKGLILSNLVGIGTDGTSVMTGCRNGVVKQLKDQCPALVGVHCAAHRCALATSQAARSIPEMESFERTISNVFRFFSNSALRENKLRDVQQLLQLSELKYADIHSVRWLSMEKAVNVLYRTYPALCMTLSDIAAGGDVVAKSLLNEITQYKFVSIMHIMMDIPPFMKGSANSFRE